jgi:hypothetical protein
MSKIKELLDNLAWDALVTGEIIIDGTTYDVWGSEELKNSLEESLDDAYESYKIGDMTFHASTILRDCDPIAYGIALSEQADSMLDNRVLVYGYTLIDQIMLANDFAETVQHSYTVQGAKK